MVTVEQPSVTNETHTYKLEVTKHINIKGYVGQEREQVHIEKQSICS
jgi:hypothetical protein